MRNVAGKIALITGGAMGMGKLLGGHFVRDGAKLVIWDLNTDEMNKTIAEHRKRGVEVVGYNVDITDVEKVKATAKKVEKEVGPVDILVNNAGIVAGGGSFDEVPIERHIKIMDVNINALMTCTHVFLPGMIERREGHIINMASAAGLMGLAYLTSYCASKFAVVGFSESLRLELRHKKLNTIKITTVCPSLVNTGMFDGANPPKMTPFLTPQHIVNKIYDGFKRDKIYVKEPFMVKTIPLLKAISHPDHLAAFGEFLGSSNIMEHYKGRDSSLDEK